MARLLAVALLLPTLLGVLPQTLLSPEEALAQAALQSLCTESGLREPGKVPAQHDQSCVLCTVGCCLSHMGDLPKPHAMIAWRAAASAVLSIDRTVAKVRAPNWRSANIPRAPPQA
ncbi:hypothetical protein [Aestuariivirga sp.]|uniref:hypothetical protein n=1 Tax=Aestuariivirga sp. TaxID=2650926 RepID=UPI0039E53370